jgi:trimeric autotransporter adhesin
MATPRWIGAALNVAQVDSITVALTWATGDTTTVTIGTRDITITLGATQTAAAMASGIKEAINGEDATTGCTFSDTGDNIPEFSEVEASLFSSTVVHVTGRTAGKPFTMSVVENTAGTGTSTEASVTAATGENWWDNTDNWDTGVLPADGDSVYIDAGPSILFGLDQSAIEPAAVYISLSFTGDIGLPEVNAEGGYHEYRSQYLSLGPAILQIGAGAGNGSGRIKINSTSDQVALTVFNSGTSADDLPAIIWKGTHASNALVQTGGDLGVAVFGGEVATLATINKSAGSLVCGTGTTLSGALVHAGGTLELNSLVDSSLTQTAGDTVINGTGNVDQLTLQGGSVTYNTTGTLGGATIVAGDGVLDFSQNPVAKTVTNAIDLFGTNSRILDPLKVVASLIVDGNQGADPGTQVVWGQNYRLQRSATA